MNIRERFIEILGEYWWALLIFVGIGYFFTDIPIFKYIVYIIAIPFALMIGGTPLKYSVDKTMRY